MDEILEAPVIKTLKTNENGEKEYEYITETFLT